MRRRSSLVLGTLASLVLVGSAHAAELQALEPSLAPRPFTAPIVDAARNSGAVAPSARASAARPTARTAASTYYAQDGTPITVEISKSYGNPPRERVQSYVDFLGTRVHGLELRRLIVFIVTPEELRGRYCAPNSLACYVPKYQIMVIPGEQTPEGQAPLEYVVTHELGHHIANNRRNDPWRAVGYGPKRWATLRGVCRGVEEERYFPTDQGERYYQNPGENWAETYAVMHYRQAPWTYDPSFSPDEATLTTAQRDVVKPWRPRAVQRRSGSVTRSRRVKSLLVETPLDGRLRLELRGPRRTNFDLQVLVGGKQVKSSSARASRDELSYDVCGSRQVVIRVVRRKGAGDFRLDVRAPR